MIQKRIVEIKKGIKKETWKDYYETWAELLDLYGAEKYSAFSVKLENSIKFNCRMCELLTNIIGHVKEYQVIWKGEVYNLVFVNSKDGFDREIILQVNKVS